MQDKFKCLLPRGVAMVTGEILKKNTISSYFKYKLQVITEVSVTQRFNNPIKNILNFQN